MSELVKAVAAAIPQSILLGIIIGTIVYSLRGPKAFTALAQFFLGLTIGVIVGCVFNLEQVLRVFDSIQTSAGVGGSGIIDLGLAPTQMRVFVQNLLIWGGIGGAIGLLRTEPGAMANGAYTGGLLGIVAGILVGAALFLLDVDIEGLYRMGVTALVVTILLVVASLRGDRRRQYFS